MATAESSERPPLAQASTEQGSRDEVCFPEVGVMRLPSIPPKNGGKNMEETAVACKKEDAVKSFRPRSEPHPPYC